MASTITIAHSQTQDVFRGRVSSSLGGCKRGRVVTVFKVVRDGPDLRVGGDTTDRKGRWSAPSVNLSGRFYARVARKNFSQADGTEVICRRARSERIRVG